MLLSNEGDRPTKLQAFRVKTETLLDATKLSELHIGTLTERPKVRRCPAIETSPEGRSFR